MRKLYSFFVALTLLAVTNASAQTITNYTFAANAGTYTYLTGSTVVPSLVADDVSASGIPIGFNFTFMGGVYNAVTVNSNGWLSFSRTPTTTAADMRTNSFATSAPGLHPIIAPLWDDLSGTTAIFSSPSYLTTGTAGSRVFTFEWKNFQPFANGTATISFQARLYEATGQIEFNYQREAGTTVFTSASAGIANSSTSFLSISSFNAPTTVSSTGSADTLKSRPLSGQQYTFTPNAVVPAAPSGLNFAPVAVTSMQLNWTDNASDETSYSISRSTDGINFVNVAVLPANTTSYSVTGLNGNTTYYWEVYATTEGRASTPVTGSQATAPCGISGVRKVGPTGIYNSLTSALNDLKVQGAQADVILELQAGYTTASESFPINVGVISCLGATNRLVIRPELGATGLVISSAVAGGTIVDSTGGSYLTIDGRAGGVGSSKDLTIENTNTGGQAIKFINGASNSIIRYCTIKGVNTSTTSGVVLFSTTNISTGNNNNLIEYCDIRDGATTPTNGIYSAGTSSLATQANTGGVVSNCNIYNYFAAGSNSFGVNLSTASTDWTISNNSFYQLASRIVTSSVTTGGIRISNTSGNNFIITGNYIGGSAPLAGGTAMTYTGSTSVGPIINAIQTSVGTTTPSSIQGNTIQNITLSGGTTSTAQAILSLGSGKIRVGDVTGNLIGSLTTPNSIVFNTTQSTSGPIFSVILATGDSTQVQNNTIANISVTATTTGTVGLRAIGIQGSTGVFTVTNNLITNITNATNASTLAIFSNASITTSPTVISNNTIQNISSTNVGTTATLNGILSQGSSGGVYTIRNNTIRNLIGASATTSATSSASVVGIAHTAATTAGQQIALNKIYNLANTSAAAAVYVVGISYSGPTTTGNVVEKNFVHSNSVVSSSATAGLIGINVAGGNATFRNNMIRLGYDSAGNSLTSGILISGLDKTTSAVNAIYHNTVYVGGTGVTNTAANTFAFRRTVTPTVADTVRNNIFTNMRSNGTAGTGKHYAVGLSANTFLINDYNLYYGTGTGFVFGYAGTPGTTDYATLAAWRTANTTLDQNSKFADPLFVGATNAYATVNLHIQTGSPAESAGILVPSVTEDYDGEDRSALSPVDIGADAGSYALSGLDVGITGLVAPAASACYTATETVTVVLRNFSSTAIDFSTNNVTVTATATGPSAYSSNIVLNSGTLAPGASMNVTLPATIDMTARGTYVFNANASVVNDLNAGNDAMNPDNRNSLTLGGTLSVGTGGNYTTLTAAVADYNAASCITGPVVFELSGTYSSTTETFPITINANAVAGSNTLTIRPASGVVTSISGSSASAIIKLNGADNIIIDGSNNGSSSRNLTIINTSTAANTAVIWLSSNGAGVGATKNIIRNLNISAGADQASTTTETFGILASGTSIGASSDGIDNTDNTFLNNAITKVRVGIQVRGIGTTPNTGTVINNNLVGPAAFGSDVIGRAGIVIQNQSGAVVNGNEVRYVGNTFAAASASGTDRIGIGVGASDGPSGSSSIVTGSSIVNNKVHDIVEERTFSAIGVLVASSATTSNNIVANNFISNVFANGTSGDQGIGLDIAAGNGDKVVFNSINMVSADIDPAGASSASEPNIGIRIVGSAVSNLTLANNISKVDVASNSATLRHYSIVVSSSSYAWGTGFSNNNDYYVNPSNAQMVLGGLGTTISSGSITSVTTLAAWKTTFTPNQDANSISADPVFNSNTDLHLNGGNNTPFDNTGVAISGINTDIDGETRNSNPDIGADEFTIVIGVDLSLQSLVAPGITGCYTSTESISVNLKNSSTLTHDFAVNPAVVKVAVTGAVTSTYTATINTGTLAPGATMLVVLPGTINMTTSGNYTFSATVATTGDVLPLNDTLPPVTRTSFIIGGTYTVGTGGSFPTLTSAVAAYNTASCSSANVVFRLTDASYPTETFPIVINKNVALGTYTLTIKPATGVSPLITGNNTTSILDLNGAKNVIIDGSNAAGGTTKNLTIINTATSGATVRLFNDASNISILNSNIEGATTSSSSGVVFIGGGITTGNDNNIIYGNLIRDRSDAAGVPANLIASIGTSTTIGNSFNVISNNTLKNFSASAIFTTSSQSGDNWTITSNDITQDAARASSMVAINFGANTGTNLIALNKIHDIVASGSSTLVGIDLGDARTTTVSRNRIYNFPSVAAATGAITGIRYSGNSSTAASVTLTNNMVSIVPAVSNSQIIKGIYDNGFSGNFFYAYHNSVYIGGTSSGTSASWAFVRGIIASTKDTTRNNIWFNDRTGGGANHFAAGDQTANGGTFSADYNIYVGTGTTAANFMDYGTSSTGTPVTVTAWQAGPPTRDANSKFSNPGVGNYTLATTFVSSSDLHLVEGNPAAGQGTALPPVNVTHDFDGQTRNLTTPDIGADENTVTLPVYTFTGTGNWTLASNWKELLIPPASQLIAGSEIVIDPSSGSCVLNVPQDVTGSKITVKANKTLIVNTVVAQ